MSDQNLPRPGLYDGRTKVERAIIEFIDEYPGETLSEVAMSVGCRPIQVWRTVRDLVYSRQAIIVGGEGNRQRAILGAGNATADKIRDYLEAHPEASEPDMADGLDATSAEIDHLIGQMVKAGSLYGHDDAWLGFRYFTKRQVYAMVGYARASRAMGNVS